MSQDSDAILIKAGFKPGEKFPKNLLIECQKKYRETIAAGGSYPFKLPKDPIEVTFHCPFQKEINMNQPLNPWQEKTRKAHIAKIKSMLETDRLVK